MAEQDADPDPPIENNEQINTNNNLLTEKNGTVALLAQQLSGYPIAERISAPIAAQILIFTFSLYYHQYHRPNHQLI